MTTQDPPMNVLICRNDKREFYHPDGQWTGQRAGAFIFKGISDAVQVFLGLREHGLSGATAIIVAFANGTELEIPFGLSGDEPLNAACQV